MIQQGLTGVHKQLRQSFFSSQHNVGFFTGAKKEILDLILASKPQDIQIGAETASNEDEDEDSDVQISKIVIGFGCEHGKHRSVSVVEALAQELPDEIRLQVKEKFPDESFSFHGVDIQVQHRDLETRNKTKRSKERQEERSKKQARMGPMG